MVPKGAISVPNLLSGEPTAGFCRPDRLPRPVVGWPDRCSPTTQHPAGADDVQPAQHRHQHHQHHVPALVEQRHQGFRWWPSRAFWRRVARGRRGWPGGVLGASGGACGPTQIASRCRAPWSRCPSRPRRRLAAPGFEVAPCQRAAVRTERTPWLTGVPARTARGARLRPGVGRVIPGAAGAVPSGAFSATVSGSSLATRARRAGALARAYDLRLPCRKCLSSPPWAGPNSPRACRRVWRPAAVV